MIFFRDEFFFYFVKFIGDDDPCSGLVSAIHFGTGHIFAVVRIGIVIDGEVDPGDGLRCRDYFDRHVWVMLGRRGVGFVIEFERCVEKVGSLCQESSITQ